jgi:predicted flap endonuclease-1-like 5' DNA nuclease
MLALYLQILLLMLGAYLCGVVFAAFVRRGLLGRARPRPAVERRVDPLPELAQTPATARFGRAGAAVERAKSATRSEDAVAAASADAARVEAAPQVAGHEARQTSAAEGPPEDLQRIKGIDADTASALKQLGVHRYAAIAAFTPAEVHRISAALALDGRIGRENWIEQAAVLARGGETQFAQRRGRGETANAAPTPDEGEPRPLSAEPPSAEASREVGAAAAAAAPPEDALAAAPTDTADEQLPEPPVPLPQQVDATSSERGQAADAAETVAAATDFAPLSAATEPDVSTRAAFADAAQRTPPEPPLAAPSAPAPGDDLLRILGVTQELAALLAHEGVLRYSQIAQWSPADVRRLEERLGVSGVIARENWIEQAQILSRGGDTAFSREYDRRNRPAAPPGTSPPAPDGEERRDALSVLGSLRSVRAEAYRNPEPGPQAAQRAAAKDKVMLSQRPDDLKRIRGIGVLIEKKLNAMGILSYEQIANWMAEDIDRVSQSLDFKGRIERENWVEQARILASGGATEFARRFDRGEVESGRFRS